MLALTSFNRAHPFNVVTSVFQATTTSTKSSRTRGSFPIHPCCGFIIGAVSSFFGYTTNSGAQGMGRAATNSVVLPSLLIVVLDVLFIKVIFFIFPESAL